MLKIAIRQVSVRPERTYISNIGGRSSNIHVLHGIRTSVYSITPVSKMLTYGPFGCNYGAALFESWRALILKTFPKISTVSRRTQITPRSCRAFSRLCCFGFYLIFNLALYSVNTPATARDIQVFAPLFPLNTAVTTAANQGNANTISGMIVLADAKTALVGATIFVASASNAANLRSKPIAELSLSGIASSKAPSTNACINCCVSCCEKPPVLAEAYTCSNGKGLFHLNLAKITTFPLQLVIKYQQKTQTIRLSINDLGTDIGSVAWVEPDANQPKIAIVQRFERLLVKSSQVQDSQANINPYAVLDSEVLLAYGVDMVSSSVEYPSFLALFTDQDHDGRADIFNFATVLLKTSWKLHLSNLESEQRRVLLEYVENGGQLYITEKPQKMPTELNLTDYI